jgi:hypothetical protein
LLSRHVAVTVATALLALLGKGLLWNTTHSGPPRKMTRWQYPLGEGCGFPPYDPRISREGGTPRRVRLPRRNCARATWNEVRAELSAIPVARCTIEKDMREAGNRVAELRRRHAQALKHDREAEQNYAIGKSRKLPEPTSPSSLMAVRRWCSSCTSPRQAAMVARAFERGSVSGSVLSESEVASEHLNRSTEASVTERQLSRRFRTQPRPSSSSAPRPVELRALHGRRRHLRQLNEDRLVEL